jgi:hypothetical protein
VVVISKKTGQPVEVPEPTPAEVALHEEQMRLAAQFPRLNPPPEPDKPHTMALLALVAYDKRDDEVAPAFVNRLRGIGKRLVEQGIGSAAFSQYLQYRRTSRPTESIPPVRYLFDDVIEWDAAGRPEATKAQPRRPAGGTPRPAGEPGYDPNEIRAAYTAKVQRQAGGR